MDGSKGVIASGTWFDESSNDFKDKLDNGDSGVKIDLGQAEFDFTGNGGYIRLKENEL
jgi:hypothetical protein